MLACTYDTEQCRATAPGPYVGGPLNGSFVTYVCDQHRDHTTHHIDSVTGVAWETGAAPKVLAGSNSNA